MALDFLGNIAPIASGIGGLLDAFGVGKPKINYGPTPSEREALSLYKAILDPDNSLVKQNTDINMQKGMLDLLMNLKQMQMMGARSQARGVRSAFFSPERADETINYLLTRGQPAIAASARDKAITDIRNTANSISGFAPAERAMITAKQKNQGTDYQNFMMQGGYGGMLNKLSGGLGDLYNAIFPASNKNMTTQVQPQNISGIYHY